MKFLFLPKLPFLSIFNIIILLISTFLLIFLTTACIYPASTFSTLYFVQYSYNQSSQFFPTIQKGYSENNLSGLEYMQVRAGMVSICAVLSNNEKDLNVTEKDAASSSLSSSSFPSSSSSVHVVNCSGYKNTSILENNFPGLNIYVGSKSSSNPIATFDPVSLAVLLCNHILTPFVTILSLGLVFVAFLSSVIRLFIKSSAGLYPTLTLNCAVLVFVSCVIWAIGAIWIEVALRATVYTINNSSATVLLASKGTRAEAMIWTAFAFLVVSSAIQAIQLYRMRRQSTPVGAKEAEEHS